MSKETVTENGASNVPLDKIVMCMDAYYYGFDKTGIPEIDRILSAVACAGKAFHYTEYWGEVVSEYPGHVGKTPIEWIQNAANDAAKALRR
jgi:hypothetical protein